MSQNLISLPMTNDELVAIDTALGDLENRLQGLVALTNMQRRSTPKMGAKSEAFCRQALNAMELNPKIVPAGVDLDDAKADLLSLDLLRPRFQRMRRLAERAVDSELALGSDVMATALQGYALLKVIGRSHGLEALRKDLGARFAPARAEPQAAAA